LAKVEDSLLQGLVQALVVVGNCGSRCAAETPVGIGLAPLSDAKGGEAGWCHRY